MENDYAEHADDGDDDVDGAMKITTSTAQPLIRLTSLFQTRLLPLAELLQASPELTL